MKTFQFTDEEKVLAEKLHEIQCRSNHIDGCGWYYRDDQWNDLTHRSFIQKARAIIEFSKENSISIDKLFNLVREASK